MVRWAISAISRLFIVAVILLAIKALSVPSARFETPLGQLLNISSPFDEIANVLK
jgi:hypothetical protein